MPRDMTPDEQHAYSRIVRLHRIIERSLFYIDPPLTYQRVMRATETLARLVDEYGWDTETIWYIGESGSCTLDTLLVGAYWFFVDYHGGQSSDEYRTQCAIGSVFNPGMTYGPEPESTEKDVYDAFESISGFKAEQGES